MTAMTRQRRLPPVDSHARRKSKQDWNASHYAQVKVSVDPVIAAGFRTACAASGISMAKALSDFMLAFSDSPMPEAVSPSQNDPLPLSSRKLRRSAVERIVDSYAPAQQRQVRVQLGESLRAVVAQRLLPRAKSGGRVAAVEVLRCTRAIASLIREGKPEQIATALQSGQREGMITLERCLANLVQTGVIKADDAKAAANDSATLDNYLG